MFQKPNIVKIPKVFESEWAGAAFWGQHSAYDFYNDHGPNTHMCTSIKWYMICVSVRELVVWFDWAWMQIAFYLDWKKKHLPIVALNL